MNIFLSDFTDTPRVKIGDFEFACKLKQGEYLVKNSGTLGYMAPEVILKEESDFK